MNRIVYRATPGTTIHEALSCGFMDKSGWTSDETAETYDRLAMIYVLRGSGHYHDSEGLSADIKAGDLFFRLPDRSHTTTICPASQWQECFVAVRAEWHAIFVQMQLMNPRVAVYSLGEDNDIPQQCYWLMEKLGAEDTPLANANNEFSMATLIQQILVRLQQQAITHFPRKDFLEKARQTIRSRAHEPVRLEQILSSIGISYSRLRNLFRQAYGISPGEYRIQVRMERACALLRSSDLSIQSIAEELGYADAFCFSKQFKQRTQYSPLKFRKTRG